MDNEFTILEVNMYDAWTFFLSLLGAFSLF